MAQNSRSSRRRSAAEAREAELRDRAAKKPLIQPETRHAIVIVIVLTFSAVAALAVMGWAGVFGDSLARGMGLLFGWQRYTVPIYLVIIGFLLLFPEKYHLTPSRWVGFILAFLSSEGLLHFTLPLSSAVRDGLDGHGGGYVGSLVSVPLRSSLGPWATGLVLFGLLLIGALVMLNTTLHNLMGQQNGLAKFLAAWKGFFWRRRLAKIQTEEGMSATPEEGLQHQQFTVGEGEEAAGEVEAEGGEEGDEKELVPVAAPVKKRERRTITIPLDLLDGTTSQPTSGNIEANKEKIQKTLETFGINVEMDDVNVGPTVTQYTLRPAEGVKLAQITALQNDLALALAAHPIRMEAPIPGKSLVGLEVPNQSVAMVRLREILDSNEFKQRKSDLSFSLGKDVSGKPWVADMGPLPHLLIAGATGSGKSVMVNGLIISMLYSNSPDDLKLILVDPKQVELSIYNGIPHLLTPVITDTTKTINALRWVVGEMDRRYSILSQAGKRNISSYRQEGGDMPYIMLVIDELASLMSVAANEVEGAIVRLAQMSRAVGIHLVLATQRPSVDVITGLIKANVTARIAFNVASAVDSRTILDMSGAEKLLGKGDMLFTSADLSKAKRLQGAYVSEQEVDRVVQFLKSRGQPDYMEEVVEKTASGNGQGIDDLGDDELLGEAKAIISQAGKASASLLQRRLRVGYARAARILDLLEKEGFIGPGDGAKAREVFGHSNEMVTPPDLPVARHEIAEAPMEEPQPAEVEEEELDEVVPEGGDNFEEEKPPESA